MNQNSHPIHRRRFLLGSVTSAVVTAAGCRQDPALLIPKTEERRDVPLRLVVVGSEQDADAIRRGWGAVTEQPIDIQVIEMNRADAGALSERVLTAAQKCDLLIYPFAFVAEASFAEVIVSLSREEVEQIDESSGHLRAALRSGAKYAGQYLAFPLGAPLPALLSSGDDSVERLVASWEDYDELVAGPWGGLAGEPAAPGWAAAMFLWRTADAKQGLFNRTDLQPLINDESHIRSLELMVRTSARYQTRRQTPDQVWSGVKSGELKGGIGFPLRRMNADGDFQIGNMPGANDLSKVLLDPFSRVISLSANCRQSGVAKRFLGWLSGGEGSSTVRQQVSGMTETRSELADETDSPSGGASSYDRWLAKRLSSPVTAPTLQLLQAGDYYSALDHQVGRALEGKIQAAEALAETARLWTATTKEVGVEKQLRAWRRAQGMRI